MLIALSFLPGHWKDEMHTKGRLHDVAHMAVFGMLAWLMARAARTRDGQIKAFFFAAMIGCAVEVMQYLIFLIPGGMHSPLEWKDILLDVMAVLIVAVVRLSMLPAPRRSGLRMDQSQR